MTPQKQLIPHDPRSGDWGDCYRTAVAIVMNMEAKDVPHFCDIDKADRIGVAACREWLRPQGFSVWTTFYPQETELQQILTTFKTHGPDVPCIIIGEKAQGTGHCVVALNGEIFCDPTTGKPDENPFVGPAENDEGKIFWWVEVIVRLPK